MFKCKECQAEYEKKPDFCDCGNDTFEEIIEQKETPIQPKKVEEEIKSEPVAKTVIQKTTNIDKSAWIMFSICIILALIVILLPVKEKEATKKLEPAKTVQNMPDIDKIWNNTPVKTVQPQKEEPKKIEKPVVKKAEPQKTTVKKNSVTKQTTPKKTVTTTPKTQPTIDKRAISSYRIKLRNHIASKIDFASVVGDGSCSFTFKVASNGALYDKKPSYLSDNDSLNEKVYYAVKNTNAYNAPPTGFNTNADLKLHVQMSGGAFEVSLNQL